jgi:hypothetical protein
MISPFTYSLYSLTHSLSLFSLSPTLSPTLSTHPTHLHTLHTLLFYYSRRARSVETGVVGIPEVPHTISCEAPLVERRRLAPSLLPSVVRPLARNSRPAGLARKGRADRMGIHLALPFLANPAMLAGIGRGASRQTVAGLRCARHLFYSLTLNQTSGEDRVGRSRSPRTSPPCRMARSTRSPCGSRAVFRLPE